MTATLTTCVPAIPADETLAPVNAELLELATQPWLVRLGGSSALVRPAGQHDLPAIARMHRRCTARTLLDRYRLGGRPPSAVALDAEVRNPYCFVVSTPGGDAIALAGVRRDPFHGGTSAELTLLVESKWQQQGLGGTLTSHLAGVAYAAGFTELIAYPATAIGPAQRLMTDVGRTRMVPATDAHMHTVLAEGATLGLGPVRQKLAA